MKTKRKKRVNKTEQLLEKILEKLTAIEARPIIGPVVIEKLVPYQPVAPQPQPWPQIYPWIGDPYPYPMGPTWIAPNTCGSGSISIPYMDVVAGDPPNTCGSASTNSVSSSIDDLNKHSSSVHLS